MCPLAVWRASGLQIMCLPFLSVPGPFYLGPLLSCINAFAEGGQRLQLITAKCDQISRAKQVV